MGEIDIITLALVKSRVKKVIEEEGLKGESAYQVAVDNGFEGTEAEWLESLKGSANLTDEDYEKIAEKVSSAESDWGALGGKEG